MRHELIVGCCLGAPAFFVSGFCLAQPRDIGEAFTVVPAVDNEAAGAVSHLEPGSRIFQDGTIKTYKIGAAGLRFLDQTTLTVYPNSSIRLDRFVYNADRTVSEVALSLTRGAFRLASGGTHTPEKYSLKTPHVTLGIRGTVLHVVAEEDASTVQALHGAFQGCNALSGWCVFVRASDQLNGARFWQNGRVELGRFSPSMGTRDSAGSASTDPLPEITRPAIPEITRAAQADGFRPPASDVFVPGPSRSAVPVAATARAVSAPTVNPTSAVCFVRGMAVLTPSGERPIETLRPGDMVCTRSGSARPVKWIPRQVFTREKGSPWPSRIAPFVVDAGALGPGCPNRALIVSGDHAIFLGETLIPARLLANGRNIRQIDYSGCVLDYFNIELETHDIIEVNGVPVESYHPSEERAREHWSNFAAFAQAYPGQERRPLAAIAPVLRSGRLATLRERARRLAAPLVGRTRLDDLRDEIARRPATPG